MKKFGHYEVTAELGRGGMGVVYKGWDPSLNRKVAIKALGEHLLNDKDLIERFTREAKATAALNDPNVIQIYFIGEEQGQPYFAMEFIEGESLDDILKGGKTLSLAHAKNLLKQACSGMSAAHKLDLVHRDIKPANMMITNDGTLKIVDFGIARTREYGDKLTNTGEFVGTPGYLSPEVCIGQDVDLRSDIFSLGIVYYEMLAGKVPFENDSPLGLMLEVVQADIPDIRELNKKVDKKTSFILKKMIAKVPEERYQNCDDIIRDLGNAIDNQPLYTIKKESKLAPDVPLRKTKISEQITLQGVQAVTQKNPTLQPQPKKSGKWGLIAASLFALVVAAGAVGYYGGYLPFSPKDSPSDANTLLAQSDEKSTDQNTEQNLSHEKGSDDAGNDPVKSVTMTSPDGEETPLVASAQQGNTENQQSGNTTDQYTDTKNSTTETGTENDTVSLAKNKILNSADSIDRNNDSSLLAHTTDIASGMNRKPEDQLSSDAKDAAAKIAALQIDTQQQASAHLSNVQTQVEKISKPVAIKLDKGVVVLALGDPAIANPVEKYLESQFKQSGIKVLNENFISGMRQALSYDFDLAEVRNLIRRNGGQVMVIANVNHIGTQQLNYAGRSSTLINAQLDIDSYDIKSGDMIGSGFGSNISYTSLNATQEATDAISQYSEELKSLLKKKI